MNAQPLITTVYIKINVVAFKYKENANTKPNSFRNTIAGHINKASKEIRKEMHLPLPYKPRISLREFLPLRPLKRLRGASSLIPSEVSGTCPSFLVEDSKDVYAARITKISQPLRRRRMIIQRNRFANTLAKSVQGAQ
jgi:hypothetical protein